MVVRPYFDFTSSSNVSLIPSKNLDMILYIMLIGRKKPTYQIYLSLYQKTFWSKIDPHDCVTKMTMWCRRQVYFHQRLLSSSAGPMYNSPTPLTIEFQKNRTGRLLDI